MNQLEAMEKLEMTLKELTATRHGRRAFLAAVPLLLTACASHKKTRYREGDNTGQDTKLTVADEQQMTKEYLPKMKKEYPIIRDAQLQNYINDMGQNIVRKNRLHRRPYTYQFSVVKADFVNAFALPAGTVMVTAPLIEMAETEAELAGVVGHEVGHVVARHTAERIDAAEKAQKKSWLFGAAGGVLGAGVGFGLGKLLCRKNDKKCLQKAAVYGAAAGVGGGLLIQKFGFMANSREDEMEADRIGFRTSVAAGFDKDHVGRFYEKLLVMEKQRQQGGGIMKSLADAMSTHPPSQDRVDQMKDMARKTKKNNKSVVSSKTFENIKKRAAQYVKKS